MKITREFTGLSGRCKALGICRSGYYAWRKRKHGKRWNENELLLGRSQENRRVYGSPGITEELREHGTRCGKNRIARIMKDNGIRAEVKRRFRKTTDSRHNYALTANLLIDRNHKGPLWAFDITFVPTREGWLYVSAVMSVQSRKIIGLSMKDQLSEKLAATALKQASPLTFILMGARCSEKLTSKPHEITALVERW